MQATGIICTGLVGTSKGIPYRYKIFGYDAAVSYRGTQEYLNLRETWQWNQKKLSVYGDELC
jgi:hypothetical protein